MKKFIALVCFLCIQPVIANESKVLSQGELIHQLVLVNSSQNKSMMKNSSVQDVDKLFSLYTDDFTYVHEAYGGVYSKNHLYNNTVKYLNSGGYNKIADRYTIVNYIVGLNTIAVQRLEDSGKLHLSVFEFKGKKVKTITEYWQ